MPPEIIKQSFVVFKGVAFLYPLYYERYGNLVLTRDRIILDYWTWKKLKAPMVKRGLFKGHIEIPLSNILSANKFLGGLRLKYSENGHKYIDYFAFGPTLHPFDISNVWVTTINKLRDPTMANMVVADPPLTTKEKQKQATLIKWGTTAVVTMFVIVVLFIFLCFFILIVADKITLIPH